MCCIFTSFYIIRAHGKSHQKLSFECYHPWHSLSRAESHWILSGYDLLLKVFIRCPRQYFGEYIFHLLKSINFEQLDSPFIYLFIKPNDFRGIVFAVWSNLWWQRLFQIRCSCIILVNWNIHCCVTNRQSNYLTEWLSYINDWEELYTTVR